MQLFVKFFNDFTKTLLNNSKHLIKNKQFCLFLCYELTNRHVKRYSSWIVC